MTKSQEFPPIHNRSVSAEQGEGCSLPVVDSATPLPPDPVDSHWLELVRRLDQNLNVTFEEMETTLGRIFDREAIKGVLFFHFDVGYRGYQDISYDLRLLANTQWLKKEIGSLLKKMDQRRGPWWYGVREKLDEVMVAAQRYASIVTKQKHGLESLRNKKCRVVSDVVTELTNYLWSQDRKNRQADIYRYVGHIVTQLTTPQCLICGTPHDFSNWREVKTRDRHKGQWTTRETRIRQHEEEGRLQFCVEELGQPRNKVEETIERARSGPFTYDSSFIPEVINPNGKKMARVREHLRTLSPE